MKYNILLLRKPTCEELEQRIDDELLNNPNFFENLSSHSSLLNYEKE